MFGDPTDSNLENSDDIIKKRRARLKKSITNPVADLNINMD